MHPIPLENPMPKLTPYLGLDGNCTGAMRFYEAALDGKIERTLTFGESPMAEQCPAKAPPSCDALGPEPTRRQPAVCG